VKTEAEAAGQQAQLMMSAVCARAQPNVSRECSATRHALSCRTVYAMVFVPVPSVAKLQFLMFQARLRRELP
jgi:hypothetical protein